MTGDVGMGIEEEDDVAEFVSIDDGEGEIVANNPDENSPS